jgi:outer membrane protein
MTAVRRLMILIGASLMATVAMAQTTGATASRTTEPVTAETDRDADNSRALRLSLDDAVKTAVENNLGVKLVGYDTDMAGESLRGQYGPFDPVATADVAHQSNKSATTSTFSPSASRSTSANFGLAQNLPTGGNYDIGWTNSRSTTTGGGAFVNPAYRSGLSLAVNQPLMRNFGTDVNRRGILIARNSLGISRESFRAQLMDTAVSVEQAYLDLIYARRNVEVVKESLFLARDQSRITQIRIDVGASAPLDILQPRVTIATSEEQLIVAVASVRDAEDRLRALLNLDRIDWDRPIVPTTEVAFSPVILDVDTAVGRALELRPEMRQQDLTIDSRRVQYQFARNQVLPRVDLGLTYNAAGVAGRSLEIDPNTGEPTGHVTSTSYDRTLSQLFENKFPSWSIGFSVAVPITNIGARAEKRRAELDLERAKVNRLSFEQTIALDVRQAARDVDTAAKSISASRAARDAAEKNLDAERKRYENGMTTNFQVLQVQQQLADSRVRELQALVGYNKALSIYHRAVGDVLEQRNISVEPAEVKEPTYWFMGLEKIDWLKFSSREHNAETK